VPFEIRKYTLSELPLGIYYNSVKRLRTEKHFRVPLFLQSSVEQSDAFFNLRCAENASDFNESPMLEGARERERDPRVYSLIIEM